MSEQLLINALMAAAKLQAVRDVMRAGLGGRYVERVSIYMKLIRNRMADDSIEEIEALRAMLFDGPGLCGADRSMLMAAAVEVGEERQYEALPPMVEPLYLMEVSNAQPN